MPEIKMLWTIINLNVIVLTLCAITTFNTIVDNIYYQIVVFLLFAFAGGLYLQKWNKEIKHLL